MKHEELQEKFGRIVSHLNEKSKRLWCANEAMSLGRGGVTLVSAATGVSRTTITEGMKEIKGEKEVRQDGIRRKGGGRKKKTDEDKTVVQDIENLICPVTLGDPESSLRWISKSTRNPAAELKRKGHEISHSSVATILREADYSLQANKKTGEGGEDHPDRNARFYYINTKTKKFQNQKQPVISVDTEKKENVGNYRNNGREYCKKKNPTEVEVYDFIGVLGKAAPYGVYDITHDNGWVNVGISHDTAEFAVNSIRKWWYEMGQALYPDARKIYITADCGGSNGYRVRLRKTELQKLADEIGREIHVSHFPPGTGKWNKIEHRMFSFISQNRRGKPLTDYVTIISLISNTRTSKGLKIGSFLDKTLYEKGKKISDEEFDSIKIYRYKFHGEWNYKISPK
jgi:transposase